MAERFDQEKFNHFTITHGVVGFCEKPITLKSGRSSPFYVNWRKVADDIFLLDQLAEHVIAFTKSRKFCPDCFFGVPEGATKLALITQYKWALQSPAFGMGTHALSMGRAKPKDHGEPRDKYFVGPPRGRVIVIEDVTTTGGSLLDTIAKLQEANVEIIAALGLTNRNEKRDDGTTVAQALAAKGIPYFSLSSAFSLLPLVLQEQAISPALQLEVEKYFATYGEQKIKLR